MRDRFFFFSFSSFTLPNGRNLRLQFSSRTSRRWR